MNNYLTAVNSGQIFKSGMVSNTASSVNMSIGLSGTAGDISTMLFGSVSGGLSARLSGGNFWEGAAIGLTVSALNHVTHRLLDPKKYILSVPSDAEGANNAGHAAVAIDHPDGTTKYVSKDGVVDGDGDGNRDNGGVFGKADYTDLSYSSTQEVLSTYPKYEQSLTFKITGSQAIRAYNAAVASAKSYYLLVGSSCIDVASAALHAAFWFDPTIYIHRESSVPNIRFYQYMYIYKYHFPTYNTH